VLVAALGGASCEDAAKAPDALRTQIEARDHARAVAAVAQGQRAVQAFQVKHGRSPGSLEELEASEGKLPTPPPGQLWSYDPATAELRLVQP